jgi:hypothetical protein
MYFNINHVGNQNPRITLRTQHRIPLNSIPSTPTITTQHVHPLHRRILDSQPKPKRRHRAQSPPRHPSTMPNPAARQKQFWLHDRDYLSSPRCRGADILEGGVFYDRVFEFCLDDVDCRARIEQFEAECEHYKRVVRRSEQRREPEVRQKWLAEQWSRAYNDWVSVYENHKDCPQTRNQHEHFRALSQAGVCAGGYGLPHRLRLGRDPNGLAIPTVGIERTHTPVRMRR